MVTQTHPVSIVYLNPRQDSFPARIGVHASKSALL